MATVTRVLPWRRQSARVESELSAIVKAFRQSEPGAPIDKIQKAYRVASESHGEQMRRSGEAYISHPLAVAKVVAEFGLDETAIIAALLHDAVEDTSLSLDEVEADFGEDVARAVDGVTKLDRLDFGSKEAQQAASVRKMMIAIAQDVRVLMIKLADRLHNMETIAVMPLDKQRRIANETLDIYAPLAHRLGMQELKQRLEDLAFAASEPKWYAELESMVAARAPERDVYITQILGTVEERLAELKIDASVSGREKNLYSIYGKMVFRHLSFDEIHDLVGIRVIVDSVRDCYSALGSIHSAWKPVPGRFKDYIAHPKFNTYQSLHTTVIGPLGKEVEVQIRTQAMHARAESGVASHWSYKQQPDERELRWLERILEWEPETADPNEFMSTLKTDLVSDEIFVFTPTGDVVELPVGATPVDFAFHIHTEIGFRCTGARVNGKLVRLDRRLRSGDRIEIITSKNPDAGPTKDWLNFVVTPKAGNRIRSWFSKERRQEFIAAGRDELSDAFRRGGFPVVSTLKGDELVTIAGEMNFVDLESMFAAIGEGKIKSSTVFARLSRDSKPTQVRQTAPTLHKPVTPSGSDSRVHIEGIDDLLARFASCCTPVRGDDIVGFVTRGRGVSIHRTDCANAQSLSVEQSDRIIDVDWDMGNEGLQNAAIEVRAFDRARLLSDVAGVMSSHQINVLDVKTRTGDDRIAHMQFGFEFADPAHLSSMLEAVRQIDSVYDAYRVLPGSGQEEPG